MTRPADLKLDVTRVAPRLYIGSAPLPGGGLARAGFRVAFFCAQEYQPTALDFPGLGTIVQCGFDDADRPPTSKEAEIIERAARRVAHFARGGHRTLVSCAAGRNRSGVVLARALTLLGFPAKGVVHHIRTVRPLALTNEHFVKYALTH